MKVAIVTGGSSGIGAATVHEFARRGWRVAVCFSRDAKKAEQVAAGLRDAMLVKGDVAQDADCRRVAKEVLAKWGRIDALINNAGITKHVKHADLEGLSADDMLGIFRVNFIGPFQMVRACAAALKESRGAVVNVSSLGAQEQQRAFAEKAPLKAAAEPEDIAAAILWFTEGARRTTGEIFFVDGGMHVASPR